MIIRHEFAEIQSFKGDPFFTFPKIRGDNSLHLHDAPSWSSLGSGKSGFLCSVFVGYLRPLKNLHKQTNYQGGYLRCPGICRKQFPILKCVCSCINNGFMPHVPELALSGLGFSLNVILELFSHPIIGQGDVLDLG